MRRARCTTTNKYMLVHTHTHSCTSETEQLPTLLWADGGYTGSLVDWCRHKLALTLEIVKRTDDMEGFVVLPRRWVAERTFAWLMHSRRLARDYETLPASSEAMIRWSMVTRMSRRLARPRAAGRR